MAPRLTQEQKDIIACMHSTPHEFGVHLLSGEVYLRNPSGVVEYVGTIPQKFIPWKRAWMEACGVPSGWSLSDAVDNLLEEDQRIFWLTDPVEEGFLDRRNEGTGSALRNRYSFFFGAVNRYATVMEHPRKSYMKSALTSSISSCSCRSWRSCR